MSIVVIGSHAMKTLFPEYREPRWDIDIMATVEEFTRYAKYLAMENGSIVKIEHTPDGDKVFAFYENKMVLECEIAWPGSLTEKLAFCGHLFWEISQQDNAVDAIIPSLDFLYMLKMSHRYKKNSPHFLKTMRDIQFMRSKGAKIDPDMMKLYKARMKATYDYAHPKLNQNKKDFFTDDVPYKYDHDSIHKAIAYLDTPAYTKVKDCQDEVFMKKVNFFEAPEMIRLLCVIEESMVLALERSIIPFESFNNPERIDAAFKMALMKVCTSITSGYFREYSYNQYDTIMRLYRIDKQNFVKRFQWGLDFRIVLPYTKPAHGVM